MIDPKTMADIVPATDEEAAAWLNLAPDESYWRMWVPRLIARIEAEKREANHWKANYNGLLTMAGKLEENHAALKARVATLEEALKPFTFGETSNISIGDLRRARAVLAGKEAGA